MSAYIVGRIILKDTETYKKYTDKVPALVEKHGGKYLVRGGAVNTLEGEAFNDRVVVIEFPSRQALQDWYDDPEYQAAMQFRHAASDGQILAVEGV